MIVGLSKEMRQGFDTIYTDFHQLFKNLEVIFARIIQGEEITQEIAQQLQTSILQLRFQIDSSFKDVLRQKYMQDAARLPILVRSKRPANDPAIINEAQIIARSAYAHAVTDATTPAARRGATLMIGIDTAGSTQSAMEEAEADNLAKHQPEEYIGYYQSVVQPYISTQLPNYANGNMWLNGARTYMNTLAIVGPTALPFAKQELDGMTQAGSDLLQFPREITKSQRFLKMLFDRYYGAGALWGDHAGEIAQQAWQIYVTTDPDFKTNYINPLQQKLSALAQQVTNWGTWNVPLTQYFEQYGSSNTFDSILKTDAYLLIPGQYNYFSNVAQSVNNFLTIAEQALTDIFNAAALDGLRFPCVAFNTDTPNIVPIDITNAVAVPQKILLGYLIGKISDIQFSYSVSSQGTNPVFSVVGNYILQNGETVNFFAGSFLHPQDTAGHVALAPGMPFTSSPGFDWIITLCADLETDPCIATSDLGDCQFPISPLLSTPKWGANYWPRTQGLEAFNAACNRLRGYAHFIYPTLMQGAYPANVSTLCVPINPWSSNGTNFNLSSGISFQAQLGSTPSVMASTYAVMLREQDITVDWAPLDNSSAEVGLMIGNKTIFSFAVNASSSTPNYTTNIHSIGHARYLITTIDQMGRVSKKPMNITQASAVISAFVNNPASTTQGIKIMRAVSRQQTINISNSATFWNMVNAKNLTIFTPEEMTFYGVNSTSPYHWTKLETIETIGIMNSHLYVIWKANPGYRTSQYVYDMTVGFDFGSQKAVAQFTIGDNQCVPDMWYYTRFTVTQENITAITCTNGFIDRGGEQLFHSSQPNSEVNSFSQIAIRISDSNAPTGLSSVTLRPINVIGFNASILPKPMQPGNWTVSNSTQGLLTSPEGLTVFGDSNYPQGSMLIQHESMSWQLKELWLKWRIEGQGSLNLQLANQEICIKQINQWIYTRVAIFKAYVLVYISTGNYDVNRGAANIIHLNTTATLEKGNIICTILPNSGQSASLTIGECVVQNVANTIFNQMFQNDGLKNRQDWIRAALNSSNPQDLANTLRTTFQDVAQLEEPFLAMADYSQYPQDIDPRFAMTLQNLQENKAAVAGSNINLSSASQRFFKAITSTRSLSRLTHTQVKEEHTPTVSQSTILRHEGLQDIHEMLDKALAQSAKLEDILYRSLPILLSTTAIGALLVICVVNRQLQNYQKLIPPRRYYDQDCEMLQNYGTNNQP